MGSGDSPPAACRDPAGPDLAGVPLAWDEAPGDLPRRFADRDALARLLRATFPQAGGDLSPFRGGRRAAAARLAALDPARYGATRNHLDGAVTRLSPYLRHGVLTLAEVRDAVLGRAEADGAPAGGARKLLQELAWRDYWQRLWRRIGDGIWVDREPLRTGHPPSSYAPDLPPDLRHARTGLACIDAMAADLHASGWLHNHARLWLAAYVVHGRRVRWQAGAAWFLEHLLDGDPASNNLSWQWVAGSFSARPYFFNRANLERFGGSRWCRACPRAGGGGAGDPQGCPFEASYEELEALLFPHAGEQAPPPEPPPAADGAPEVALQGAQEATGGTPPRRPVLWIHEEALGPANPALRAWPGRPALFVFDPAWVEGTGGPGPPRPLSLKRLGFLLECLLELPVTVRVGTVAEQVRTFARRHGADGVVGSRPVDPRLRRHAAAIAAALPLRLLEPEPFLDLPESPGRPLDLRRFHRYWKRAEPLLLGRR
jgi:deoxyribodipyrimidine photo-lyase